MRNTNDNIITINGSSDNIFDKAIFVLKPQQLEDPNSLDFVKEADKILNNYMLKTLSEVNNTKITPVTVQKTNYKTKPTYSKYIKRPKRLNSWIDKLLGFSILFCSLVVMYLLFTM